MAAFFFNWTPRFSPLLLLSAFLFCPLASAREKPQLPDTPKPHHTFWIGVTALAGAETFDAIQTRRLLDRGGWENNPILGRHPSSARQGLIDGAFFAGEASLFYKTEHCRKRYWRWTGRVHVTFTPVRNE